MDKDVKYKTPQPGDPILGTTLTVEYRKASDPSTGRFTVLASDGSERAIFWEPNLQAWKES
jgi:hypothetical protein